jgi:hypothetical protein
MSLIFNRERFGKPQILAGLLLLAFLTQCLCLVRAYTKSSPPDSREISRLQTGVAKWRGQLPVSSGLSPQRSPLWELVAGAPLLLWRTPMDASNFPSWAWLPRVLDLLAGCLLGASLWYVARRLFGNSGGYVSLALYCFSPGMVRAATGVGSEPEMFAAWGAFGAVFTAIAAAHTLYAPREVVLWNWRRILLLGVSLTMAIGMQFSLAVLLPLALAFLLYLAPERRRAALGIWSAAAVLFGLLLSASYFFQFATFVAGLRHARFVDVTPAAFLLPETYRHLALEIGSACPLLSLLLPVCLVVYAAWPRARYFGNTAPLLVAVLCLVLAAGAPHFPGAGFALVAIPFLFCFLAGIFADLLETRHSARIRVFLIAALSGYALWDLTILARL